MARILAEKPQKVKDITGDAISKDSSTLHEAQSIIKLFSFCADVIPLSWLFMRKFSDFAASYPNGCSRFSKCHISSQIRFDLRC